MYHYDSSGKLIAETDGNGNLQRDYVYLNGELLAVRIYGTQAGIYYFINDHLGTPQKIVNNSGQVVRSAAYLPFGKAQVTTETVANNLRFPGQYFDAESGLHYNWHRYYDPETGRYITADPIGLDGGLNLYVYVMGNPVNRVDIFGLSAEDRVSYVLDQYYNNNWHWSTYSMFPLRLPIPKCNEFVYASHCIGDPNGHLYPTVLREGGYFVPNVSHLADPCFAKDSLEYLTLREAIPGDIIVWYDKSRSIHHTAMYIGNYEVIYASKVGLKKNSVLNMFPGVTPIVRRFRY